MNNETEEYIFKENFFIGKGANTIDLPKTKSTVEWGEKSKIIVSLTQKFNWFQRLMWKIFFGAKVRNINESEEKNERK